MTAPDDLARTELAQVILRGVHRRISGPPISSLVFDAVADEVLAHLASVVSRRDADLRTRPTTLQAVEDFAESLAQEAERYADDDETGDVTAEWVRDRFADWRRRHALSAADDRAARYDRLIEFAKWERQD